MSTSTLAPPATTRLSELPLGQSGWVETIECNGLIRRRLLDLGFVPGARVDAILDNPAGDPRVYRIRGANVALRAADAARVVVRLDPPPGDGGNGCGAVSSCGACPFQRNLPGPPLDSGDGKFEYLVALAGNPNTGKSTVFNALTGLRQHVGNWPGKTVARAEGLFDYQGRRFRLVDLPGTYSLLSTSTDEEVARDFILFGAPDCTVVVVDATCLERNLNLVLQILEITGRVVVCVNLIDEARRKGIAIDRKELERDLGVPVVLAAARNGEGLDELKEAVLGVASGRIATAPPRIVYEPELEAAVAELVPLIEQAVPGLPNARWIALRLIDGSDRRLREEFESGVLADLAGRIGGASLAGLRPDLRPARR